MNSSSFDTDLKKEQKLSVFVDTLYSRHLKSHSYKRISSLKQQLKGVDVEFINIQNEKVYYIDEKAQLDYLNEDLPTFAFEVSYLKDGNRKKGWLFDTDKKTDFYSLITAIFSDAPGQFTSCKITLVNRQLLLNFLRNRAIDFNALNLPQKHGKHEIPELHPKREGYLFLSKQNKAEEPLNLVLKLRFLIASGIGKQLI